MKTIKSPVNMLLCFHNLKHEKEREKKKKFKIRHTFKYVLKLEELASRNFPPSF